MTTKTLADFEATLLSASLSEARPNKSNPNKVEYYVTIAIPAHMGADLLAVMATVAPNGDTNAVKLSVEPNKRKAKPFAGIPDDALILRASAFSDAPPDLFGLDGKRIPNGPLGSGAVREQLFAGQKVRVNGFPFFWQHDTGGRGISWNLTGVLAVGGGERRAGASGGESSESAFARYAAISGDSMPATNQVANAPAPAPAPSNDPFNQGGNANPFG